MDKGIKGDQEKYGTIYLKKYVDQTGDDKPEIDINEGKWRRPTLLRSLLDINKLNNFTDIYLSKNIKKYI